MSFLFALKQKVYVKRIKNNSMMKIMLIIRTTFLDEKKSNKQKEIYREKWKMIWEKGEREREKRRTEEQADRP